VLAGVAPSWAEALELTPNQIVGAVEALAAARSGTGTAQPTARRGTKEDFKAAVLGAIG
jgi:hypothetical protein